MVPVSNPSSPVAVWSASSLLVHVTVLPTGNVTFRCDEGEAADVGRDSHRRLAPPIG
jgi:hypothetical protein